MPIVITLEKRDTRPSQIEIVYFAKTLEPNMDMDLYDQQSYLIWHHKVHIKVHWLEEWNFILSPQLQGSFGLLQRM